LTPCEHTLCAGQTSIYNSQFAKQFVGWVKPKQLLTYADDSVHVWPFSPVCVLVGCVCVYWLRQTPANVHITYLSVCVCVCI